MLIFLTNEIRDFGGDNCEDIRKTKVQVIFLPNGLIMGAVC